VNVWICEIELYICYVNNDKQTHNDMNKMNPYYGFTMDELKEAFDVQNTLANNARRDLVACDNPVYGKYIRKALDEADLRCKQINDVFMDLAVAKHCN